MSWGQYPPVVEPMVPQPPNDAVAVDSWAHPMTDVRRRVSQLCTVAIVVVAPLFPPATTDAGGGTIAALGSYELTQYQSLTGPLDTSPFLFITHDWQTPHRPMPRLVAPRPASSAVAPLYVPDVTTGTPQTPSVVAASWVLRRPQTAPQAQTFAAPPYVPDVTHPVTLESWQGQLPAWNRRVTIAAALHPVHVSPTFIPDETQPVPIGSWRGSYPDVLVRSLPRVPWFQALSRPTGDIVEPVSTAGGGSISTRSRKLWQYQSMASPFTPTAAVVPDGSWAPVLVDRPGVRAYPVALRTAWTMDRFDAPAAPTVPDEATWHPTYPARIHRAKPAAWLQPFAVDAKWSAPQTFVDQVGIGFLPFLPPPVRRPTARHQHIWAQPHFVIEIPVPVMSWTGLYLDPPVLRKSFRAVLHQQQPWPSNIADVTQVVQESSWDSSFPDRIFAKVPASKSLVSQTAIFVPGTTVVAPTLGARAIFPDRVYGKPRAAEYKAWTMDATYTAPAGPVVPALAVVVYPSRVPGRAPLTPHPAHLWPALVLDVTAPVTPLSWAPQYPDWLLRALRYPERHEGFNGDPLPHPPPAPVVFLAAWALGANRYVSFPVDLIREPAQHTAIDRAFLDTVFARIVFSTDRSDR